MERRISRSDSPSALSMTPVDETTVAPNTCWLRLTKPASPQASAILRVVSDDICVTRNLARFD